MIFLCNAFNDPSSPWYYVIGVIFLALIFSALAAYIILSKRKSSSESDNGEKPKAEKLEEGANQSETVKSEDEKQNR